MCYTFDACCIDVQCFSTGVSVPVIKDALFRIVVCTSPFLFCFDSRVDCSLW